MDSSIEKLLRADQLIINCKKEAKILKHTSGKSLMECQNIIAKQKGFYDWHNLHSKIKDKYIVSFNPVEDLIINSLINGYNHIVFSFKDENNPYIKIVNEKGISTDHPYIHNLLNFFKLFLTKNKRKIKDFNIDFWSDKIIYETSKKAKGAISYQAVPGYPNGFEIYIKLCLMEKHFTSLEDLGFSKEQSEILLNSKKGLLLFAGTAGSGRSTSIDCLINQISMNKEIKAAKINYYTQESLYLNKYPTYNATENLAETISQALIDKPDIIKFSILKSKEQVRDIINAGKQPGKPLLISSLHASSGLSVLDRLEDFEVENIESSNLCTSVYQTLVPTLCPYCKIKKDTTLEYMQKNFPYLENVMSKSDIYFKGNGCQQCHEGIQGRTVCAEIIEIDEQAIKIIKNKGIKEFKKYWLDLDDHNFFSSKIAGKTPHQHAIKKMLEGKISPEDVTNNFGAKSYKIS